MSYRRAMVTLKLQLFCFTNARRALTGAAARRQRSAARSGKLKFTSLTVNGNRRALTIHFGVEKVVGFILGPVCL